MKKQNNYWMIGGIVVIVIIVIWLLAVSYNRRQGNEAPTEPQMSASESGNGAMTGQEGMNQGTGESAGGADLDPLDQYLQDQNGIMAEMMDGMGSVEKTGSASLDFLYGMIPHHESAVDMAESYLKNGGEHKELKPLAEAIIETQTDEIWQMKNMIEELKEQGQIDREKEAAYMSEYNQMLSGHHEGHGGGDSLDQAFAEGMIMHHQMAVDMAQSILNYADEEDVKTLAQNIVTTQEEEIKQMQSVINGLGHANH